jgi:succinyl-CoA synthetase beta subunit
LINIFGGIVRCDRVAQGVVDAYKNMGDTLKCQLLFVYKVQMLKLLRVIDDSGMPILSAVQFQEAADQVQSAFLII